MQLAILLLVLVAQAAAPALPPLTWGTAITLGGALLTSFGLSKVKGLDTGLTNSPVFRKLQPAITLGGAFLAPWLAQHLGVQVDPASWSAAPFATLVAVTGAELAAIGRRTK